MDIIPNYRYRFWRGPITTQCFVHFPDARELSLESSIQEFWPYLVSLNTKYHVCIYICVCIIMYIYMYICICIYNPITYSFPMAFKVLWCSKCEASQGYDTSGIQPVVKNNQHICVLIQNIWLLIQDVISVRLLQGKVWFNTKLEFLSVRFGYFLSVRIARGINLVFSKLSSKCMSVTIM